MSFWEKCPDDILFVLFKNFDLKTRLIASRTCQRWSHILKDPRSNMEDVGEILFREERVRHENDLENIKSILCDHIGKVDVLDLFKQDLDVLAFVSELVNTGRFRCKQFNLGHVDSISDPIDAILPSTIRELELWADEQQIVDCRWSEFSQLERLTLHSVLIDMSTPTLPKLKYLVVRFSFSLDDSTGNRVEILNTLLERLPSLVELCVVRLNFDDKSFRLFLNTVKNYLPNLNRLQFGETHFHTPDIYSMLKEFDGSNFSTIKTLEFESCYNEWVDIVEFFLRVSGTLDTLILTVMAKGRIEDVEKIRKIYQLTTLMKTKRIKLDLRVFSSKTVQMNGFEQISTPIEFCDVLSRLYTHGISSSLYLQQLLNCDTYEKMTKIAFGRCEGLKDEMFKMIAQNCPRLLKMDIEDCKQISEIGLRWFIIYWNIRTYDHLSIEVNQSIPVDGLFGTSYSSDHGIFLDGKYWKVFRKTFSINKQICTRLIVWDKGYSLGDANRKMLVIRGYNKNGLAITNAMHI